MKNALWGMTLVLLPTLAVADAVALLRPQLRPAALDQSLLQAPTQDTAADPKVQPVDARAASQQTVVVPEKPAQLPAHSTLPRPPARLGNLPRTRWQHMEGHSVWTRAALAALKDHGTALVELEPRDIGQWCPSYVQASMAQRRAFWVGFLSALAKHESTYRPWAVGGGGRWFGLLQILPSTARGYKCNVGTGEALKNGAANLSCAVRIMAHTVPRDGVIHGYRGKRGQGVTADWGPMHSAAKRKDMAGWLRRQNYCKPLGLTRPKSRP